VRLRVANVKVRLRVCNVNSIGIASDGDGDAEALGLSDGLALAEGDKLGDTLGDAEGDALADGLSDGDVIQIPTYTPIRFQVHKIQCLEIRFCVLRVSCIIDVYHSIDLDHEASA